MIRGTVVSCDGLIEGVELDENRAIELAVLIRLRSDSARQNAAAAGLDRGPGEFCVGGQLGGIGVGQPYYDWTAFARVTEARFGTAGFNSLRGPGVFSSDLGLFRRFAMSERLRMEFRAEAFNWTNTPKFNNPSGGINSLQLNPDGSFRTGVFEVTGTNSYGRDVGERIIRLAVEPWT